MNSAAASTPINKIGTKWGRRALPAQNHLLLRLPRNHRKLPRASSASVTSRCGRFERARLANADVIDDFAALTGIGDIRSWPRPPRRNVALDGLALHFLAELNRYIPQAVHDRPNPGIVPIKALLEANLPGEGWPVSRQRLSNSIGCSRRQRSGCASASLLTTPHCFTRTSRATRMLNQRRRSASPTPSPSRPCCGGTRPTRSGPCDTKSDYARGTRVPVRGR